MLRAKCLCFSLSVALLLLVATAAQATYMDTVLANNPVGYWRLGETGSTSSTDLSTNANSAVIQGGAVLGAVAGAMPNDVNKAATTDGSDSSRSSINAISGDHTNPTGLYNFEVTDAFTLEAWIKPSGTRKIVEGVLGGLDSQGNGYWFGLKTHSSTNNQTELCTQMADDKGHEVTLTSVGAQSTLLNGGWHQVVLTHAAGGSSSSLAFYVDGSPFTSTTADDSAGPVTEMSVHTLGALDHIGLSIGARTAGPGSTPWCYTGGIDEAAVFGYALSANDIAAHWAARNDVALPEPSVIALLVTGAIGLLAYAWKKRN
jgi:hypothetical protein